MFSPFNLFYSPLSEFAHFIIRAALLRENLVRANLNVLKVDTLIRVFCKRRGCVDTFIRVDFFAVSASAGIYTRALFQSGV